MGRAQIFQAEAAGITPDVRMNPVLLKPTSDRQAQVVLMGKVATNMDAVSYHDYKPRLREQILAVYNSLAQEYDVIVLEGAGSPAEINLRDRDIVNMGMAEMAQCPVILVADIDRGSVFAAIYGTLALLHKQERDRVKASLSTNSAATWRYLFRYRTNRIAYRRPGPGSDAVAGCGSGR